MVAKRKMDEYYMSRALSLAWRGLDETCPNPKVGCVLVREGRVIGEGYHARCGGDHAEVAALADMAKKGENAKGATAYVTLEPCSHFGKTPPCAPRLIEEGVTRVVVGMMDPNPKVRGAGLDMLKTAGVEVVLSCMEEECRWLNRGFIRSKTLERPWITLKAATSLDGKMALGNGESRWITGPTARSWAHLMRAEHDGILVGSGTILKDDPELTVRHTCGKSPLRIILDSGLSLPESSKVIKGGCLILTCRGDAGKKRRLEDAGAEVCIVPEKDGAIDLEAALRELSARNVQMLMIEGGPGVLSSFIAGGLGDSLTLFTSTALMGEGPGPADGLHFDFMKDIVQLRNVKTRRAGSDMLLEGIFQCSPAL